MTEHNLEHLKVIAGKILHLTNKDEPANNFAFPVKKLRAMAEYILDSTYPNPVTEYNQKDDPSHKAIKDLGLPWEVPPAPPLEDPEDYPATDRQLAVYNIIDDMVRENIQPTLDNITAKHGELPKTTVTHVVNELIEIGYLAREGNKRRIVLK